jgi:two-component sensor histidine kinase
MAEVNHRAKNLLAVVQAVAQQTAKSGDLPSYVERLSNRIGGLAAGQDLLVKNQWQGVEVSELVEAQLEHFKDLIGTRVLIEGPRAHFTTAAAQGIGMALHELATNASKYGALSNLKGQVRICWHISLAAKPVFSMRWSENGGPKVEEPAQKGFGQVIIGRMAEASVLGTAEIRFHAKGLSWTLSAAAENALTGRRRDESAQSNA